MAIEIPNHVQEELSDAGCGTLYLGIVLSSSETGTSVPTTPRRIPRFLCKHTNIRKLVSSVKKVTYITIFYSRISASVYVIYKNIQLVMRRFVPIFKLQSK